MKIPSHFLIVKSLPILAVGAVLISASASAKGGLFSLGVEPIVGYERTQLWIPTSHTKDRMFYGVRVTAGFLVIAAEGEVTRAMSTELFPERGLSLRDTDDRAKLGLRAKVRLLGLIYGHARAGGQALLRTHEETTNGVTVIRKEPMKVKPYAGAGLRAHLGHLIQVFGDMTVVFAAWPQFDKNDYQATAGFTVSFP